MKKKIYTTPALSVEEYEMVIITAASGGNTTVSGVNTNLPDQDALHFSPEGSSNPRAKGRGIWDED